MHVARRSGGPVLRPARRSETPLGGDGAVLAAYREYFGIVLDRPPTAG